jgi:hypothetical protein
MGFQRRDVVNRRVRRMTMKTFQSVLQAWLPQMHLPIPRMKSSQSVRMARAAKNVYVYDQGRFSGLSANVANAYARFAEKSKATSQQKYF